MPHWKNLKGAQHMSHNLCAIAVSALIYCSLLYWLPILSGWRAITLSSYHGGFLDGAKTVDENVHSVLHRSSWMWKKRKWDLVALTALLTRWHSLPRIAQLAPGFLFRVAYYSQLAPTFPPPPSINKQIIKGMVHTKLVKYVCQQWAMRGNFLSSMLLHKAIKSLIMQVAHSDLNRWFPLRCLQKAREFQDISSQAIQQN